MQVIALHEMARGAFSIHEPPASGPVTLDCGEAPETDGQLQNELQRILDARGYLPLRRLAIEVQESRVVLRGNVPTFYLKQLAQSAVRAFAVDCEISNLVEVTNSA